jgi:hypothetical protein
MFWQLPELSRVLHAICKVPLSEVDETQRCDLVHAKL